MYSHSDASVATDRARLGRPALLAAAAAGTLLVGLAVVVVLTGDMPDKAALAERQVLVVATPIGVGLYAWREGSHARLGRLLVLAGGGWFLAALGSSSHELLYSIGRVAGWAVEAGLIYLILAFPSGRLTTRIDRVLVGASVAVVVVLFLPTAFISEAYPAPSLFSSCTAECPGNAFMLLDSEPAFLDGVVVPLRELLVISIMLVVTIRLADRIRRATRLMRRTLVPVLVVAILRTLVLAIAIILRRAGVDEATVAALAGVVALGLPALCLAFLIGLIRWRLYTADVLVSLAHRLGTKPEVEQRREVVAQTLMDPTVELAYWRSGSGGGWVDGDEQPTTLPAPGSDRCVTRISDDGTHLAAVIHDPALREQHSFVEAVGAYALVWDDNRRLAARVETSLRELQASRTRILVAADDERRRIERDLHDGGQQRLVALRIRLKLAEETMGRSPTRAGNMLRALGDDVDTALDELRALAAGVYPALLAARGLPDALRTAALQSLVPTSVAVDGSDRYPEEIETAAYFCCIEALQNVAKHASEASSVTISLQRNGDLRFEVRDDGPGFAVEDNGEGHGLVNMRDRMAAVGGELEIRSTPGAGTEVVGIIPVAAV